MRKIIFLITMIIFLNLNSVGQCREVVFLLDTNQSMNQSDPLHRASESITWMTANFTDDDKIGIIYFNDTPTIFRTLSSLKDKPNLSFDIAYNGYSNAGDALLKAIDMLSPDPKEDRSIIMITDGSIALNDPNDTLQSIEKFQSGIKQAEWSGIKIFILNLRYQGDRNDNNFYNIYAKNIPVPQWELMTAARTLIHNEFHTPHIELSTNGIIKGKIAVDVPINSINRLKFILTSSNPGAAAIKNVIPDSTIQSKYVNVFEMKLPNSNHFEFEIDYPEGTGLTLDVIAEVVGELQVEAANTLFNGRELQIKAIHTGDSSNEIFSNKYFDDKKINLQVNNENLTANVDEGIIIAKLDEVDHVDLQKVHFEDLGVRFVGNDNFSVDISEKNYLAWILALIAIATILFLLYTLRRKDQIEQEQQNQSPPPIIKSSNANVDKSPKIENLTKPTQIKLNKSEPEIEKPIVKSKKISYNGKLIIYVTKSNIDEDIEPREFNLFRLFDARDITLAEILDKSNINIKFEGAKNILISPSPRGVYLRNNSDCAITKRNNLLLKNERTELYYNDSIYISSSDETSEIILMFKSLKPA
ncbi:MAG: VWA domain-containing protein [Selenomonadaceae bacterium]|nr:VWA domain-containing protein [Selenomonadaceae bacterium]